MIAARHALAAALAAGVLAGCVSYNPLVAFGIKSEPAHKPTELAPITSQVTPKAVWSTNVGKSGGFSFRPDAEGGRIYAAAADGTITVLEEDSGRLVTRVETRKPVSGGVEVGASRILVGTTKGEVIALDTTGKQVWVSSIANKPKLTSTIVLVTTATMRRSPSMDADRVRANGRAGAVDRRVA